MANPLRKTLEFLGLAEESNTEEWSEQRPAPVTSGQQQSAQRATVTPLRRARGSQAPDVNEILTVHPKKYEDAKLIAETFRDGIPVVMNLTQMSESEARRMVDFASGLTQGLYGHIERVTPKVFLLSPSHVQVSGEASDDVDNDALLD
ncbi:cell division protein SepF [Pontimonas sp.]|jgi:cell division inhibitor SepF|uniref:cell division protein SepF n=1 Tax=Pontimonas sp. TaxID=2304492 RepID=UPI0028702824|nr:cell division protein SepF [Pontimonas sp.]MDR9397077.1 cell division protein SepF [Pontimonas sp.]MDR9433894.1 cell division protein SepF [Pontimonas sp.]